MTALPFTSLRALLTERRRQVVTAALALAGTATLGAGIHFASGLLQALGYAVIVHLSTQAVALLLTQPETRRRGRSA